MSAAHESHRYLLKKEPVAVAFDMRRCTFYRRDHETHRDRPPLSNASRHYAQRLRCAQAEAYKKRSAHRTLPMHRTQTLQ